MDQQETLSNVDYERRLLGAALRWPDAREALTQRLTIKDFTHPHHRAVFHVISQRVLSGADLDAALVRNDLRKVDPAFGVDEPDALAAQVWRDAGAQAAVDEYIEGVKSCSWARTMHRMGQQLSVDALATGGEPQAVTKALTDADEAIRDLTDKVVDAPWESIHDIAAKVAEGDGSLDPLFHTGFPDLDRTLQGGVRPGQLVVVAARPAQGKSTLALDISRSASLHQGVPGLALSFEMSSAEIGARLLSAEGAVPLSNIQRNAISDDDVARLEGVVEGIVTSPFYVVDNLESNLPAIVSTIIAAHRRLGIKYVTLDYVQLVTDDGTNNPSREQVVANISRRLKSLCLSLGIAIILVAQLNRGPEQRSDKRPQVSDLRESGQLEQDGDIILLIFQPQTYDPATPRGGEADLIVGKHRNGPTGTVVTHFQGHYARFVSASQEADHDAATGASASPAA